jgi:hypothetical protein
MIPDRRSALRSLLFSLGIASIAFFGVAAARAQTPEPASRITQRIDENNLVTLHGNTHPLAKAQYDQGAAPDNLPTDRILLLLQRSTAQEAGLRQLLDAQKSNSSPNFHEWLTPAQFGQQFGPSDADVQTITSWLQSHGFTVNAVSAGRTLIDFSGNSGQVREAFHTQIHSYLMNGKSHWANSSDPQIPAALAPVIAGIVSLNNFPKKPQYKTMGRILPQATTGAKPGETPTSLQCAFQIGTTPCYAVAPYDFATIYNVLPLWNAGIDGTGQTIAIVGETDINCQDVINFRSFFGLSTNFPDNCGPASNVQIILDGPDPGYQSDETEADLDVEWSGAVAKGAHIDFVTSESTETTQGIDLSAEYIIDNNLAPVMSESYGECEADLLASGNEFYDQLWEQAAAQGITVITSAGDSGSAGCDDDDTQLFAEQGANVSGLNSTPFNVSAGGTDFNDVSNPSTYWSASNNSTTQESALGYIPEIPWDDSCAASGIATACSTDSIEEDVFVTGGLNIVGAGGGQSNCVDSVVEREEISCETSTSFPDGGYPKPAWQKGAAVTGLASTDGVRDVPDISLYAAAESASNSFYPICESDANANNAPCNTFDNFFPVGGTSSSAPAFAGVMAMINQYMAAQSPSVPRQGNANYELYTLANNQVTAATSCTSDSSPNTASNTGCTFYDITTGSNSVPCAGASLGCSNTSGTSTFAGVVEQATSSGAPDGTVAWVAGSGYDLATGLGSVNVYNLVHKWPAVVGAFKPSASTLTLCTGGTAVCQSGGSATALTFVHGTSVNVEVGVAAASGYTGTPSGNAVLLGTPNPLDTGSASLNAAVDIFRFTSEPLNIDAYPLGSGGTFSGPTTYLAGGTYAITTHYAGDDIFGASDSLGVNVIISRENSAATLTPYGYSPLAGEYEPLATSTPVPYGTAELFRVDVLGSSSGQETATGSITFTDEGTGLTQTSVNGGASEPFALNAEGFAEFQTPTYGVFNNATQISAYVIQPLAVGTHSIQASYLGAQNSYVGTTTAGDSSYNQSQTAAFALTVTKAATEIAFPTVTSTSASCVSGATSGFLLGNSVTLAALIATNSYGNVPTGVVTFTSAGSGVLPGVVLTPVYDETYGFSELCASVAYTPKASESVTATYSGDANYAAPTTTASVSISTVAYVISPPAGNTSANPVPILAPGDTGTATLTIQDPSATSTMLSATVTSAPEGAIDLPVCSILGNPIKASGPVTLTCTTTAVSTAHVPPAPLARPNLPRAPFSWLLIAAATLLAILILFASPERRRGYALLVLLLVVAAGAGVACGGGGGGIAGGGGGGGGATGTTVGEYEITVSGTPAGGTAEVWFNVQ